MKINTFNLENYLLQHEILSQHFLCKSDAESVSMSELLALSDPEDENLWNSLNLGYSTGLGIPSLRELIGQKMYSGLKPQHILSFSGAEESGLISLYALCEPTDHVIVLTPCYSALIRIPQFKGCEVTQLALREENNWCIDIDAIRSMIKPNTKWLIINFPHNPSGQVITPDELKVLIKLLDEHGIWLFSDESARLLGSPIEGWAEPAAVLYPKAVSLSGMSKTFGLGGLRTSWIACQELCAINQIRQIMSYTNIGNSGPSELLSLIALKNKKTLLARNNQILADNFVILDLFFTKNQKLFSWVWPQGGCAGLVRYKGTENVDLFCKKLLRETGIVLMPASVYDLNENYFRIGFGHKDMATAIDKLQQYLEINSL